MKIVINRCFGGFGLSEEALALLDIEYAWDIQRNDPRLVEVVERLGKAANGACSELRVVEIPDGVEYNLSDYDGVETIHEKHRMWP
jgi:hypothetical protein